MCTPLLSTEQLQREEKGFSSMPSHSCHRTGTAPSMLLAPALCALGRGEAQPSSRNAGLCGSCLQPALLPNAVLMHGFPRSNSD